MKYLGILLHLFIVLTAVISQDGSKKVKNSFRASAYKKYSSFAVTSDSQICSNIGKSVLLKNGSAVDAAIATMLCVGVTNLHSCGIGGGHMAIIYGTPKNKKEKILTTIVAKERAPSRASRDMFKSASSQTGGLAVGIPGEIKGYHSAWKRFGKLPWKELFVPTIKLLKNGFKVERILGKVISLLGKSHLKQSPNMMALYSKNDGTFLKPGDIIKDPKLAETMRVIAGDPESFYGGPLAKKIAKEIREAGGIITEEDLKSYKTEWKEPTAVKLQGTNLTHHSLRPPSSGIIVGLILNIMAGYKLRSEAFTPKNLALTYHRLVESFKFSFPARGKLGDEKFSNMSQLVQQMSSRKFAELIRSKIEDTKTYNDSAHYTDVLHQFDDHGTSHLCVYGPDGSAVALTSTINTWFGSLVKGSETGILYNNNMDDFSSPSFNNYFDYEPSLTNYIEPGKFPMSSMSPSFIMDSEGRVTLITGAEGGSMIITVVSGVITNCLWANETLAQSVDRARVHHQLSPNVLRHDDWLEEKYKKELTSRGHKLEAHMMSPVSNAIKINCIGKECIEAVADGRKDGEPGGM